MEETVRATWDRGRALRTVEDIIRIYPGGAPTMVILDRLDRMGIEEHDAMRFLDEMRAAGSITTQLGRWVLSRDL